MKTIMYYISDYGYGHASRSIAIIRELLRQHPTINIMVCHSFALSFIKDSIQDKRVNYRNIKTDIGYFLKENAIELDRLKLEIEYKHYISHYENMVKNETEFLRSYQPDLIISDISPIAFEAADQLHIPSIAISNFTWFTAYQDLLSTDLLQPIKHSYEKVDYFFLLAANNEPNWARKETISYGFYSRKFDHLEVARLRNHLIKNKKEKIVYVGLGMKIKHLDLSHLSFWDDENIKFIVSSNMNIDKPNVYKIPPRYTETQHYIAASDLVISKPGWGTVSEAVLSNRPLLLLERESMPEDKNTIQHLKEKGLCSTVRWEELKDLQLEGYFNTQDKFSIQKDDSSEIGKKIVAILERYKD